MYVSEMLLLPLEGTATPQLDIRARNILAGEKRDTRTDGTDGRKDGN
jgi:hypothetical protein